MTLGIAVDEDESLREIAQWKQRYFGALQDLEQRQRQWRADDELLRKTISRLTLVADGLDEGLDAQLQALRDAIRERADSGILKQRIDGMSGALVCLDRRPRPVAEEKPEKPRGRGFLKRLFSRLRNDGCAAVGRRSAAPVSNTEVSARHILVELLQRLSLPPALEARAASLCEQLESGDPPQGWAKMLDQIAALVTELRQYAQQEQQSIEEFLVRIGERLRQVDEHLQGSADWHEQSAESGRALDDAVCREVRGIEDSVQQASDLEQMKQAVQQRLDAVVTHMARHREAEEARHAQARQRIEAMSERLRAVEQEASTLRGRVHDQRSQAMTDALTGIPNRLAWEERIHQEIARKQRFGMPLVLLIWDVDHFKSINDNYGHKAGDKALRKLAGVLQQGVRETDFLARYGGEEFVMLMTGSAVADCLGLAERLRASVQDTGFHFRGRSVTITVSCGLTEFGDDDSIEQAFERADRSLYRAKETGRNRCLIG